MKIASWNVNSVKVRLPLLLAFLKEAQPDVLCLQETKCPAADFPALEVKGLGYHVEALGQRAYNGVALLSKEPPQGLVQGLPGDEDDNQARYLEASFGEVRVASIYLPNGNPVDTDKFTYKLGWMKRLVAHARGLLPNETRSSWPATTTSARRTRTSTTRSPFATTRCAGSKRARSSGRSSIWD